MGKFEKTSNILTDISLLRFLQRSLKKNLKFLGSLTSLGTPFPSREYLKRLNLFFLFSDNFYSPFGEINIKRFPCFNSIIRKLAPHRAKKLNKNLRVSFLLSKDLNFGGYIMLFE